MVLNWYWSSGKTRKKEGYVKGFCKVFLKFLRVKKCQCEGFPLLAKIIVGFLSLTVNIVCLGRTNMPITFLTLDEELIFYNTFL